MKISDDKLRKLKIEYEKQKNDYIKVIETVKKEGLYNLIDCQIETLLSEIKSLSPKKRKIQLEIIADYSKEDLVDMGYSPQEIKGINDRIVNTFMRTVDRGGKVNLKEILNKSIIAWENQEKRINSTIEKSKNADEKINKALNNLSNIAAGVGMLICNLNNFKETMSLGAHISICQSIVHLSFAISCF